jgi:AraC family transcriptional regulator, transcriptional activator of pobA
MDSFIPVKNKIGAGNYIKVEPFRKGTGKTVPHKHKQYFEIIYLTGGNGEHWIDDMEYAIKPNVMFFITQDQVHNWDLHTEPEGFVLILKKAFTEKSLDRDLDMMLQNLHNTSCLYMEEEPAIGQIFELMSRENNVSSEMTFHIMEGLLKALLAKILSNPQLEAQRSAVRTNLYTAFLELLSQNQLAKMKVAHYAAMLNTTPQNLNAACRKAANQSAAEVIADFTMNEAKRLLRYTNKTVSEISLSMNFGDPSHFVKFFKRMSGHTPNIYRSLK